MATWHQTRRYRHGLRCSELVSLQWHQVDWKATQARHTAMLSVIIAFCIVLTIKLFHG